MSSLFGGLNSTQNKPAGGLFSNPSTGAPSGGLFSTPSSSAPSGGLFSGLNTSKPAAPSGGLFSTPGALSGNQAQNQITTSAPSGGLFGSLNASGSAQQNPQQNQQPAGGLFGQAPARSLFGAPQTSQPPQQAANSLFGGSQNPQAQPPTSTPQASLSQSQQGQNNAYFDSILERSRKRNHADATPEDLPQLQLGLGDLRQRIKRLGPGSQDRTADGRAHYLLAASGVDPGTAVRDLNHFNVSMGKAERATPIDTNDGDVERYLANLQTQTTLSMISEGLERSIRDFDTFLEENLTIEWDAQRKRIYQHFGIKPREGLDRGNPSFAASTSAGEPQVGFGRSRRSKAAQLASSRTARPNSGSPAAPFGLQKSVIGATGPPGSGNQPLFADVEKKMEAHGVVPAGPYDRLQREKESRYTGKVKALISARLKKRCFPICDEFASVVKVSNEHFSTELVKAYRAVIEIVGENPDITSPADPNAVKELQFADHYLDENPNSPQHQLVKKRILRGGARCLEKLKFEEMEEFIAKNPREANLGGIPNVISKVKAYVRLQAARKNLAAENIGLQQLEDDYVWVLIYYLLRTGHVQETVEYVASNAVAFRAIDRNFASYITDYANSPDRRLRRDLQDRINGEYNQRIRIAPEDSIDPYRMACYKIIGRCDLRNRQLDGIKQAGLEDFMWLQFALAREINRVDEIASEVYSLSDAQALLKEIGNRHFSTKGGASDVGSSWGAFVLYQIALGMFEEAVSYLYTYSYVDGVHLAIALDYYGLLRVSDPNTAGDDLVSLTTRGNSQINFGRMLGYYTRDFRAADVGAAVDYLTLICLNKDLPGQLGLNQTALCHEALRELVLESREFALLLGDIQGDGQRIKGVIEERMLLIGLDETDDFMRAITIQAASVADDNGRITDAVLLYHLAGEFDNVIVIITRALSEAINTPIGEEQLRLQPLKPRQVDNVPQTKVIEPTLSLTSIDDPVVLANAMVEVYGRSNMYISKIKDANKTACLTLLKMNEAKSRVEASQWTGALDIIRELDILPLDAQGNASKIRSFATKFSALPQAVANCVPSLLMWTITSCNKERSNLMRREYGGNDGTRLLMIQELKQNNMDLTTYTSQLRYRFPAHLHEALARAQLE